MDCKNYIRILHKMEDNKMYVCGTNAFDPECDYMVRHSESGFSLVPDSVAISAFIHLNVCSPTQMVS